MKKSLVMFCLILFSWSAFTQHDHDHNNHNKKQKMNHQENMVMFKDASLTKAYGHYLDLKDALVASDQKVAKQASKALQKELQENNAETKVAQQADLVAKASSLAEQRKIFTELSQNMTALVKGNNLSMGKIYLEYCPMANNNKGGSWLSNEKEIKNPYFGEMMLKCGRVKETIQ